MCTPAAAERRDVLLDGGVLPHLCVHCGAHHDGRAGRDHRRREQPVGEARRVGRDEPGRGRCDDDDVGVLTEPGVRDRAPSSSHSPVLHGSEASDENVSGPDEAGRLLGEDRGHVRAQVHEPPADLDGLVRRDPSGYPENDEPILEGQSVTTGSSFRSARAPPWRSRKPGDA